MRDFFGQCYYWRQNLQFEMFPDPGNVYELENDRNLPDNGLDLEELNRKIVSRTLQKFQGNQTRTAEYLGS